jgi:hypothetical protein
METEKKTFEDLSIHQRLQFLHDLFMRVKPMLPRGKAPHVLGSQSAESSNEDLLRSNLFFLSLLYANHLSNQPVMQGIYRKLYPRDSLCLPHRFRCHSVIMLLFVHLYNQFYPVIVSERILTLCCLALTRLKAINDLEATRLGDVVDFKRDTKTLLFCFQRTRYHCQLNPKNGYGYELTLLPDLVEGASFKDEVAE